MGHASDTTGVSLQTISSLEKDIAGLKKEIGERDETIGDKEKRIYDLKKKNQVNLATALEQSCHGMSVAARWKAYMTSTLTPCATSFLLSG